AGLDGIDRGLAPPEPVTVDPHRLSSDEREAIGIAPYPATVGHALDALAQDDVLTAALGETLTRSYLAVRRPEWEADAGPHQPLGPRPPGHAAVPSPVDRRGAQSRYPPVRHRCLLQDRGHVGDQEPGRPRAGGQRVDVPELPCPRRPATALALVGRERHRHALHEPGRILRKGRYVQQRSPARTRSGPPRHLGNSRRG